MTIRDVIDVLFAARARIDFYWNFYVVVVIAVIGWLISAKKTLTRPMKALVTVVYLIFAVMNLIALYSSYTFAEALRIDLLRMTPNTSLADTRALLQEHSYASLRGAAIWIHVVLGAAILAVVWLGRFGETTPGEADVKASLAAPAE